MKKPIFLALCLFLLSSCSVFSPIRLETDNQYRLNATPSISTAKRTRATLLVAPPVTSSIFNTTQMVYTVRPYQISYFAKSHWAATPTEMLQNLMIETLQKTHYFHAVTQTPTNNRYSYILSSQLIELIQDFSYTRSLIRMTLEAQIIEINTNRIIATKRFSITEPAQPTPYGGVIAANRATAQLLREITEFCMRSIH